jgi:hypothetical protein
VKAARRAMTYVDLIEFELHLVTVPASYDLSCYYGMAASMWSVLAGPWQCVLFLIPRSFHDGSAVNYSTAPPTAVFCLLK